MIIRYINDNDETVKLTRGFISIKLTAQNSVLINTIWDWLPGILGILLHTADLLNTVAKFDEIMLYVHT